MLLSFRSFRTALSAFRVFEMGRLLPYVYVALCDPSGLVVVDGRMFALCQNRAKPQNQTKKPGEPFGSSWL